jgi:hypothetical protein
MPLAEQVGRLVEDLFDAVAHRGIKVGDDSTWLFASELYQLLEEPYIVVCGLPAEKGDTQNNISSFTRHTGDNRQRQFMLVCLVGGIHEYYV